MEQSGVVIQAFLDRHTHRQTALIHPWAVARSQETIHACETKVWDDRRGQHRISDTSLFRLAPTDSSVAASKRISEQLAQQFHGWAIPSTVKPTPSSLQSRKIYIHARRWGHVWL